MLKTLYLAAIVSLISITAGCSYLKFPGVYRISIQQGNVVTQEMLDQLQPGMTKRQVRFVMGTPLIDDPFVSDRWDYFYSYTNPRAKTVNHSVVVVFMNDSLSDLVLTEPFKLPESFKRSPDQS
ncbi:outer membrane protein assembly factor BamE [Halioxenophilus sp. WMMB6]|uniref:outer membrane protein assembly factor BamE n=1 Tax=Halioxenophilus sp. WMMB6 TaxID=3073815 RepID=UPI00295F2D7D|nr:outer membrane protein assembly factor BamE [Halioxenophilus sp. WMMB6]